MEVIVRNNNVDGALKKLKKKLQNDGVIQQFRKKQEYEKPSDKKRRVKKALRKKHLKMKRKLEEFDNR